MDWNDLRYALEVGRTGSLAAAARALGVAHTTVYRRINALEEAKGVRLFERLPTGYELTQAGRDLVEVGEDVEGKIIALERGFDASDALDGEVLFSTVEPLALRLTAHFHTFYKRYPRIRVVLRVSSSRADLGRREADVVVRVAVSPGDELVGRRVGALRFAVFGRRSIGGVDRSNVDLQDERWICFDESLSESPQGRWETANVPAARVVFRTNSRAVFLELVSSGMGVGVLPCDLAEQSPGLVRLSEPLSQLATPLWVLTRPELQHVPRIRALVTFLHEVIQGERDLSSEPTSEVEGAASQNGD